MRRVVPLIVTLMTEAATVIGLHFLGGRAPFTIPYRHVGDWLKTAPLPEAIAAITRLALEIGAWWLLTTTVFFVISQILQAPKAVRASTRITPKPLRHRIERALAASLVAGTLLVGATPALADEPLPDPPTPEPTALATPADPPPAPTPEPDPIPVVDTPAVDTPAADPAPIDAPPPTPVRTGRAGDVAALAEVTTEFPNPTIDVPVRTPGSEPHTSTAQHPSTPTRAKSKKEGNTSEQAHTPSAPTAAGYEGATSGPTPIDAIAPSTHTVVEGDNLWNIATAALATATGRTINDLTNAEVVTYWVKVCEMNRPNLRSGNPDLIYAGEQITLPPV